MTKTATPAATTVEAPEETEEQKRTRKPREKQPLMLEQQGDAGNWFPVADAPDFEDVSDAVNHVVKNELEGDFRVATVKSKFSAKSETVKKIIIT